MRTRAISIVCDVQDQTLEPQTDSDCFFSWGALTPKAGNLEISEKVRGAITIKCHIADNVGEIILCLGSIKIIAFFGQGVLCTLQGKNDIRMSYCTQANRTFPRVP